jgi:hypothetical protein
MFLFYFPRQGAMLRGNQEIIVFYCRWEMFSPTPNTSHSLTSVIYLHDKRGLIASEESAQPAQRQQRRTTSSRALRFGVGVGVAESERAGCKVCTKVRCDLI